MHQDTPISMLAVRQMVEEDGTASLGLKVLAGEKGLDRYITIPRIQKPGLALAGFYEVIHPGRVQILGESEIAYLRRLTDERVAEVLKSIFAREPTCFIISKDLEPPPPLLELSRSRDVPVLQTGLRSSHLITRVTHYLESRLGPRSSLHGVMLDLFGIGVLLIGQSGIGKSECALDLVERGHRLVSDDLVELKRRTYDLVTGSAPGDAGHYMELRGLGLINIKDLFGVSAIRRTKRVDIVVRLEPWDEEEEYDRLGLDEKKYAILGVEFPLLRMPVAPGRNLATLIEVAARNQLLKEKGFNPAKEFARQMARRMRENREAIEANERDLE